MNEDWKPFHAGDYLETPEDVADFLSIALENGDQATFQLALREIARSEGMSKIAREAGLNRESLYRALSEKGNPTLETVFKVTKALGLKLTLARA